LLSGVSLCFSLYLCLLGALYDPVSIQTLMAFLVMNLKRMVRLAPSVIRAYEERYLLLPIEHPFHLPDYSIRLLRIVKGSGIDAL
jgi:hypothetical protein